MGIAKSKTLLLIWIVGAVFVLLIGLSADQFFRVRKAHSSFENYYAFRGCTQLLQRTATYGICQTGDGKTIKIVQYKGKWYLDGDLPVCYFHKYCL